MKGQLDAVQLIDALKDVEDVIRDINWKEVDNFPFGDNVMKDIGALTKTVLAIKGYQDYTKKK